MFELISGYKDFFSRFDFIILTFGGMLFVFQFYLLGKYYRTLSNQPLNHLRWCSNICELFPLLGLFGTVCGLLNTFQNVQVEADTGFDIVSMLGQFGPALTTTVSGILALMVNLAVNLILLLVIDYSRNREGRR